MPAEQAIIKKTTLWFNWYLINFGKQSEGWIKGQVDMFLFFFLIFYYLKQLLEKIAQTTGGMYVMVQNMDELSTFFKRQVLLSRFIAQTAHGKSGDGYFSVMQLF